MAQPAEQNLFGKAKFDDVPKTNPTQTLPLLQKTQADVDVDAVERNEKCKRVYLDFERTGKYSVLPKRPLSQ